ncbi:MULTISPECIES: aspartate kinase [Acetobacterium]|uniref:Aspartokinase n=1 Tax=Acetobacterium wieringae TaxID=52694 RepID=A0A1F2PDV0_9FIRM|nr:MULTISPECIES: aspartate kinase [Acetobacterium]OFV69579.1 aspartokinase [Acetobacterium wieringae]OXS26550.1 MAG: aspartate kinase [Acetobacterium sp. MES1]URN82769.1 aspartate kinase [Acetobacterium wieringae]
MNIVVQKYGGTSVGSTERIINVAKRIIAKKQSGHQVVVVVSAMGKTTDDLVKLAYDINPTPPKRELDRLLSTGEQISISLLSMALQALGHDAISFTGPQVGIRTSGRHTKSRIEGIDTTKILESLNDDKIVIIAGFQGVNENDDVTTLGRGGSDTSAVALACVLEAPCEIYTDVEGIYGVDPRLYPQAKKLDTVSYEEMLEMASLGAGVMHPRAIELGSKYDTPIWVASSELEIPGTIITKGENNMEGQSITGVAIDNDEIMITIRDVPFDRNITSQFFSQFATKSINIDMISQSAPIDDLINISFTAPASDLADAKKVLAAFQDKHPGIGVIINEQVSKLSVVGIGMRSQSGVAAKFFSLLADNNIQMLMITTSEIRISCIIPEKDKDLAVTATAQAFDL